MEICNPVLPEVSSLYVSRNFPHSPNSFAFFHIRFIITEDFQTFLQSSSILLSEQLALHRLYDEQVRQRCPQGPNLPTFSFAVHGQIWARDLSEGKMKLDERVEGCWRLNVSRHSRIYDHG